MTAPRKVSSSYVVRREPSRILLVPSLQGLSNDVFFFFSLLAEELSEEDQQLKSELEMLVERLKV